MRGLTQNRFYKEILRFKAKGRFCVSHVYLSFWGDKLQFKVRLPQITRHRTSCDATLFFKEGLLNQTSFEKGGGAERRRIFLNFLRGVEICSV
ncbi:MAG: hypothetical protein A2887_02210 [Alphaproteobacteria bacterium RIFCSPLOWO2_01_FULL_40_26]|nr:MAG: hypothetical protein A3D15_02980 [Alphaproteobacteria bacterium RIFCSPHIGHO2_02_FULL_40_34]OFW85471.1 MAG: hypothetical protein A2794_00035 [Alphaproteobacteria bacterium RIFCSPHIGHO2_01_FULL_40_8]OFW94781.1 MAG: hypothetical protein A2887_02210 [Alphaproteobacteria bacterium RIFCSPLOWO2_01_FULL_40_26]OFX10410.1 MAG: hypothetical protein A3H30_03205 [Alphaproteobacteria bacterium RIFCSPLOWO2_02_FULL_40_19]OFX11290.1 MAG: hypothetical protein A3G22_06095 [Alphaproteobacteria bacterium RI